MDKDRIRQILKEVRGSREERKSTSALSGPWEKETGKRKESQDPGSRIHLARPARGRGGKNSVGGDENEGGRHAQHLELDSGKVWSGVDSQSLEWI